MRIPARFFALAAAALLLASCGSNKHFRERTSVPFNSRVLIATDSGNIIVRLYDSTPLHRDNFVKLVRQRFYDSLLFHRVIPNFMIQGGDPTSKNAKPGNKLGDGGDDMPRIAAEIRPNYYNKRGALSAARDDNPEKASSACQFYIVTGRVFTPAELDAFAKRSGNTFSEEQKTIYTTIGGAPWLDGKYTVFGEVESGIEVAEKIARMPRDASDRPRTDVRVYMKILRAPKKR